MERVSSFEAVANAQTKLGYDPTKVDSHQECQRARQQEWQHLMVSDVNKEVDCNVDSDYEQWDGKSVEGHQWKHLVLLLLDQNLPEIAEKPAENKERDQELNVLAHSNH